MMRLETMTRLPTTRSGPTPLLFVHGAFCGVWFWENFLPYFADHGYESHALSLRGHGGSEGRERLRFIRTGEYVEDVADVCRRLSAPPVLIGHSLGGYVVQKYLETHAAPAAVLLASVPVTGMLRMQVRLLARHPLKATKAHLTWSPYALFETPDLAREAFFSADMPADALNRYFGLFQDESYYACLEATFLRLPRPGRIGPLPMLVLGGENDAAFSRRELEATARAYGTQAEFFPNMAHAMPVEAGWQKVADRILEWLREKGL